MGRCRACDWRQGEIGLLVGHVYTNIIRNLTINEYLNWKKYK